jgi:signal peptidase I
VQGNDLVVPPGKYFAMGDNRDNSLDSRYWGFVPRENIVGRPLLVYWSIAMPESSDEHSPIADRAFSTMHEAKFLRRDAVEQDSSSHRVSLRVKQAG